MNISKKIIYQLVYPDKAILRAYANSYYWLIHNKSNKINYNLGYV